MRSKASIDGHPVHPALIPFPFAFLTGSYLFDVGGRFLDKPAWWTTGYHLALAGLATSVAAAIPGFIDYARTVPPKSSGRKRATQHMVLVLGAVVAFAAATLFRRSAASEPSYTILAIETIGAILLMAGGSLGGTLVFRDQISVDHRYPANTTWREATVEMDGYGWVDAATTTELGIDQMKLLRIDDQRVVLARTRTGYVAFDDACTHEGGSLAGGTMVCGTVQCPWHGSQFDTRSGCVRAGPAERSLDVYEVAESEGVVRVRL
jgi:nitrite reductase/ring-hydroxylating ferredoxin subunit/uncharacterized membrane protein